MFELRFFIGFEYFFVKKKFRALYYVREFTDFFILKFKISFKSNRHFVIDNESKGPIFA